MWKVPKDVSEDELSAGNRDALHIILAAFSACVSHEPCVSTALPSQLSSGEVDRCVVFV